MKRTVSYIPPSVGGMEQTFNDFFILEVRCEARLLLDEEMLCKRQPEQKTEK